MTLNERETATVLAALRFWRKTSGAPYMMGSFTPEDVVKYRTGIMPDYFEDESPLTDEEIDSLCEAINFAPREEFMTFTPDDVDLQFEAVKEFEEDDEIEPLTAEEKREIWEHFKDKEWVAETMCREGNEAMQDIIRDVLKEREVAA